MVNTLIVAFIVLTFVAILLRGAGDLLLTKLRPRPRDRGEEIRNKMRPLLILPVISQESSVTWLPIGATKSALPVQNTPMPTWHETANSARTDHVAHEEWLPPRPDRATVPETARAVPIMHGGDALDGATVVFQRPADQPVQILPGRFKVLAGDPGREDIHFIGQIGTEARLMIGRNVGASHEVVTLQSLTVSRRHAQMQFANGCWIISNLSETNPVIVNDEPLDRIGRTHRLIDGDRVALGEVVLQFHAH